jgi:protein-L-isoaspartate(D-aspartate) O-methyltransferase
VVGETGSPKRLVQNLIQSGIVMSEATQDAFRAVPRHLFLGDYLIQGEDEAGITIWTRKAPDLDLVYSDEPCVVQVKNNMPSVSCSAPSVIAQMLDDLDLSLGMKVLEIGTGTGWTAALIASLVGETGAVYSVEIDGSFAAQAKETLKELGVENVRVVHGDGVYGYPEQAPYDRIVVHAGIGWLPVAWQEQLAADGMLLALRQSPNVQHMLLMRSTGTGLLGAATRFSYFGEIKAGEDDVRASFSLDPSSFRFPDLGSLPLAGEAEGLFPLAETQDFLFYLNLQQPPLQVQVFMLYPEDGSPDHSMPVIVDALSNEVLAGSEPCSNRIYGSIKLFKLLAREQRRWEELGSPTLADYLFTAVPLAHNNHTGARHLPLNVPGEVYYIPPPGAGYLDWVIRLVE